MTSRIVVEWAPFHLADGVTDQQLLTASEALQTGFLERQPGFLNRELLRGKDGGWVDLVHWADAAAAEAAMKAAAESMTCLSYFHLMAGGDTMSPDQGVLHFTRAASYGRGAPPTGAAPPRDPSG